MESATPEQVAELREHVGEGRWAVFCSWIDSGRYVEDGEGLPSVVDFEDAYRGTWDSFRDYLEDDADNTGLFVGASGTLEKYFDWEKWERNERHGYTLCEAPVGGVFVFLDL